MRIGPVQPRLYPTENSSEVVRRNEMATSPKKDNIEISAEGRKKLAELADGEQVSDNEKTLSVRLLKIRNKIEAGYYDLPFVKNEIVEALTEMMLQEKPKTEE